MYFFYVMFISHCFLFICCILHSCFPYFSALQYLIFGKQAELEFLMIQSSLKINNKE